VKHKSTLLKMLVAQGVLLHGRVAGRCGPSFQRPPPSTAHACAPTAHSYDTWSTTSNTTRDTASAWPVHQTLTLQTLVRVVAGACCCQVWPILPYRHNDSTTPVHQQLIPLILGALSKTQPKKLRVPGS
jgi:hypothetical protein